jgi:hypothetical protein
MAQQPHHDHPSIARPVRTRFEPGHLAQACLVDAYTRLVPLQRRRRRALLEAGVLDAGATSGCAASQRQQQEGQRCS